MFCVQVNFVMSYLPDTTELNVIIIAEVTFYLISCNEHLNTLSM